MPIPTDTYWNIRRLNVVFALSSLALLATLVWSVAHDYGRPWRKHQSSGAAWDAELTRRRMDAALSAADRAKLADLRAFLVRLDAALDAGSADGSALAAEASALGTKHAPALSATERDALDRLATVLADPASSGGIAEYASHGRRARELARTLAAREFTFAQVKGEHAVASRALEEARAAGDTAAVTKRQAELDRILARLPEPSKTLEEEEQRLAGLRKQIKEARDAQGRVAAPVDALRAQVRALGEELDLLARKLDALEPAGRAARASAWVRRLPLLGWVNPPEKVRQLVLPDVLMDVSFMKIETIDRCVTCHVHAERPEFSRENVIAHLEQRLAEAGGPAALPGFWRGWAKLLAPEAAADGQDDAVLLAAALKEKLDAPTWEMLRERYRRALVRELNARRAAAGQEPLDPSPVFLAHPRLDLYVTPGGPHDLEKVGCTSCHDGAGQETDFVLAAHAPREVWVDAESGEVVLDAQLILPPDTIADPAEDLADVRAASLRQGRSAAFTNLAGRPAPAAPRAVRGAGPLDYRDPATGQVRRAVPQADHWAAKHEPASGTSFDAVAHLWDTPMRPRAYLEASCARCHSDVHDVREEAPALAEGRSLFASAGCVNCHPMASVAPDDHTDPAARTRRVGPDLRHVTDKLSPAFIDTWTWAPRAFRPSTAMPHVYLLENNSSPEELRRSRQEVLAIRTYLEKTATAPPPPPPTPPGEMPAVEEEGSDAQKEAIARGRAIFIGLEGSPANPQGITDRMGGVGCVGCHTNLNEVARRWITEDLVKSGDLAAEMRAANGRAPTRRQLADEALRRYRAMNHNEKHRYALERFTTPGARYPDGSPRPVFERQGPELSGVGTKLLAGRTREQALAWLYRWLLDPRGHAPATVMPSLRLTPREAMDLAEYLLAQRRTVLDPDDDWAAAEMPADEAKTVELTALFLRGQMSDADARREAADDGAMARRLRTLATGQLGLAEAQAEAFVASMTPAERRRVFLGSKLIAHYGCMNCHAINGMERVATPCPDLSDWGAKPVDQLDFGYLSEHKAAEMRAGGPATVPLVNALSADAARAGELVPSPAKLDWVSVPHRRAAWLEQKLRNPRAFDRGRSLLEPADGSPGRPYDKLRMPAFFLDDRQVHALVTFVLSSRDRLISERLAARAMPPEARSIAAGRRLAEKYNCTSCHRIEDESPSIQQYWAQGFFDRGEMAAKAPPSLRSQGARVHPAWAFNFLLHVEREGTPSPADGRRRIRPQPYVRMPSFPMSPDEATALVAYFQAAGEREAQRLERLLRPLLVEARDAQLEARGLPRRPPDAPMAEFDDVWPDHGWHRRPKHAAAAEALRAWAVRHTLARPADFAPDNAPEAIDQAYKLALFDARVMERALRGPYPFATYDRPTPSPQRFAAGEKLYHVIQCQSCHVLGDEKDPRVLAWPKGPNLAMARARVLRPWAQRWVREPQTIHPGSPMASIFFSGRGVASPDDPSKVLFSLDGTTHAPGAPAPAPGVVEQLRAEFGRTPQEQVDLVLDFIYAAGLAGYTSRDPVEPPPATQPASTQPASTQPAASTTPAP